MTETPPATDAAAILWFLPTHGDGRHHGTDAGARHIGVPQPGRPRCGRSRLFRFPAVGNPGQVAARMPE
jgi:hypothetical protein